MVEIIISDSESFQHKKLNYICNKNDDLLPCIGDIVKNQELNEFLSKEYLHLQSLIEDFYAKALTIKA